MHTGNCGSFKIVETMPGDNFYAKYEIILSNNDDAKKAALLFEGFISDCFVENEKVLFFREVILFARCIFFDCYLGEKDDEEGIVECLSLKELHALYASIDEDIMGFICEDTGGSWFEIIPAKYAYDNGWHGLEEFGKDISIDFVGFTKKIPSVASET